VKVLRVWVVLGVCHGLVLLRMVKGVVLSVGMSVSVLVGLSVWMDLLRVVLRVV